MPISLVRSSTTVHDIGDADAADDQRERADDAEKSTERYEKRAEELFVLCRVPQHQRFFIIFVEFVFRAQNLVDTFLDGFGVARIIGPPDDVVDILAPVHRLERG